MRVLGVDPGLTRCGIGVIEGAPGRQLRLIGTDVIRTPPSDGIGARLLALEQLEVHERLAGVPVRLDREDLDLARGEDRRPDREHRIHPLSVRSHRVTN